MTDLDEGLTALDAVRERLAGDRDPILLADLDTIERVIRATAGEVERAEYEACKARENAEREEQAAMEARDEAEELRDDIKRLQARFDQFKRDVATVAEEAR